MIKKLFSHLCTCSKYRAYSKRASIFALLFAVQISAVYSQEASEFNEEHFTNDIPIIVSASRIPQRETEAPESVSIIDRDTIKALGVINIVDIFRLVPGFQVAHVSGNTYAVTYHGLSYDYPRRLQVLVDGRSVYRPLLSNVDWANLGISVSDIERIEVLRGPNTPAYGTNAFMGTINIVTQEPFQDQGFRIESIRGTQGFQKNFLKYAGNINKFEYRATAEYRKSHGFEDVDDSREISIGSVRGIYNFDVFTTLEVQFGYSGGALGADGDGTALNPKRDKQVNSSYAFMRWNKILSNEEDIQIKFYHNYYKQEDTFSVGPLSDFSPNIPPEQQNTIVELGVFNGIGERFDLELNHNVRLTDDLQLVWGVGIRRDKIIGEKIIDQEGSIEDNSGRIFSSVVWNPTRQTIVNIGGMLEDNDIVGTTFSPRLAINYKLAEYESIRFSATKAFRSPSLYEANNKSSIKGDDGAALIVTYDNDDNLVAEELVSYELGYIVKFALSKLSFDIKLFKEELDNFISAPFDRQYPQPTALNTVLGSQAKVWTNGGYSDTKGIEFQVAFTPFENSLLHISYAYARVSGSFLSEINPEIRDDLSNNIPRNTSSVLWQHKTSNNWRGSVAYYFMTEMEWGGGGDVIPRYDRWDFNIIKTLSFGKTRGEFGLTAQNLTGKIYSEFRYRNEFGRRVFLQFKLSL